MFFLLIYSSESFWHESIISSIENAFFSFGILIIIRIFSGNFQLGGGPPTMESIPWWVFINYDISHSFVSAFLCIWIVNRYRKDIAFAMWAWPFHILLDFPFHSKAFFPTKLLYPFTDFSFDGIPWSRPEIWFPNLAGILILFIYRRYDQYFKVFVFIYQMARIVIRFKADIFIHDFFRQIIIGQI